MYTMRILLWGCISSPWTMWFIRDFLLKYNYEVYILETSITEQHRKFFENNKINIIKCPSLVAEWYKNGKKGNCFKTLYIYFLQIKTVLNSGKYDIINLHYVDEFNVLLCVLLKQLQKSKLILSYWGSDLFRMPIKVLKRTGRMVKHADYITFDNGDMKTEFDRLYPWSYKKRNDVVFLGLPILNIIEQKMKSLSKEEIRKKWNIPLDKKVVSVGYNAIPEQQHLAVINCISRLCEEDKTNIFLLFQMTYARDEEYCLQVKRCAEASGCEFMFLEHFLPDEQVAEIRIITDIYINAQKTDAFSGSVCENLFSQTVLVNAKWLRYKEFDKVKFKFIEFSDWIDLEDKLNNALNENADLSSNSELIWSMRSWERCAPKWEEVYRGVLNEK